MTTRTKNSYDTFLGMFLQFPVLIICPTCSKKAFVKNINFSAGINVDNSSEKVVCTNCGFSKTLQEKPISVIRSQKGKTVGRRYIVGHPIDPIFHYQLWLTIEFERNLIWAYNYEHLNFLKEHISSTLRERNTEKIYNSSLGSRLPKWMTSKSNRDILLKKITDLENKE